MLGAVQEPSAQFVRKPPAYQMRPALSTNLESERSLRFTSRPSPAPLTALLTSQLLLLTPGRSQLQVMPSHVHIPAPTLREGLPTDLALMRLLS